MREDCLSDEGSTNGIKLRCAVKVGVYVALKHHYSKIFSMKNPLRLVLISAFLIITTFNIIRLTGNILSLNKIRKVRPYAFYGRLFEGITPLLKGTQYVGYMTDKDLSQNAHAMHFAQAQYALAPVIMDLNNANHPYVIFDYENPVEAVRKIKELGLVPYKQNAGLILVKNP